MKLRFNFHGLIGIALIILMFGIAYAWNWTIDWLYFVAAVGLYAVAVISLTMRQASLEDSIYKRSTLSNITRLLFSLHCALAFLAIGLWLHFPDDRSNFAFFLAATAVGLAIPFSLLTIGEDDGLKFNPYGVLGVVAIILLFGFAFRWQWNIDWLYFVGATIFYSVAVISLVKGFEYSETLNIFRFLVGCHFALLILAVGLLLHFKDGGINLAFFLGGTAGGLAFPFLLMRS